MTRLAGLTFAYGSGYCPKGAFKKFCPRLLYPALIREIGVVRCAERSGRLDGDDRGWLLMIMTPCLSRAMRLGFCLAAARIAILWVLIFREAAHRQSVAELPLIVLLYPEGLVLPRTFEWTVGRGFALSGVLLLGSLLIAGFVGHAVRFLRS